MRRVLANDPDAQRLFWESIAAGSLVVYPTDTLYGLGAAAASHTTVKQLAALKGRAGPFSIMLGNIQQLNDYALVPQEITVKLEGMLPGPYTILLTPRSPDALSPLVVSDVGKAGFRIPNHPFIQAVFQGRIAPVTSTSVNRTAQKPLQNPDEIENQFGNHIDLLIDAGNLSQSLGSTVLDPTMEPWRILRQGDGRL